MRCSFSPFTVGVFQCAVNSVRSCNDSECVLLRRRRAGRYATTSMLIDWNSNDKDKDKDAAGRDARDVHRRSHSVGMVAEEERQVDGVDVDAVVRLYRPE